MKSSSQLVTGKVYTRANLREIFGISDATLNNGIFKPKGQNSVWLFVTEEKTSDRTQYHDLLEGDQLTMQGQTKGRTDHLIIDHAGRGDELLLFYRKSKTEHPGAGFVYEGAFEYVQNVGSLPTTFTLRRVRSARKAGWQLALEAVEAHGGRATLDQVRAYVRAQGHSDVGNVGTNLDLLSVNSPSRTSHGYNSRPRRTDSGSIYDRLLKVSRNRNPSYELYGPTIHGTWEIYAVPNAVSRSGLSVRLVDDVGPQIEDAQDDAEVDGSFDAGDIQDARNRVMASIVRRRGQRKFREALLDAYGSACAITGCQVVEILEAAHIYGYKGDQTNVCANGLLLRADMHTLFDLKLIAVESESMTLRVSPALARTEYAELEGRKLADTKDLGQRPSRIELDRHRALCGW